MLNGKFIASTVQREAWGTIVILAPNDRQSELQAVTLTLNPGPLADSFQGGQTVDLMFSHRFQYSAVNPRRSTD